MPEPTNYLPTIYIYRNGLWAQHWHIITSQVDIVNLLELHIY